MAVRLSSLSTEYVKVPVKWIEEGQAVDPTLLPVKFAFLISGEPIEADWKTGSWETGGSTYFARCLVGPAGVATLADGTYAMWLRVTSTPETPVKRVGTLVIE